MMNFCLQKEERIYLRDELQLLFRQAKAFNKFPFRVLHLSVPKKTPDSIPLKFAVSIPKKRFKSAVDRNLLKRRTREAYRLNRNDLKAALSNKDFSVLFIVIYIGNEQESYPIIEEKIILILRQLQDIYAKDS